MKTLAKILLRSFLSMLLASAILGGFITGPKGIFAAPILMIFGWFYFPVVFALQAAAFECWPVFSKKLHGRIYFTVLGAVIAAALFSLIGIKEQGGAWWFYTIGYAVGASVAATASCLWISSQGPVEADQGNPPQ